MKLRITTLLVATVATIGALWGAAPTTMTVCSYNIRVITPEDDGAHDWDQRKEEVAQTVIDNNPDVVGFNEVRLGRQEADLKALLPGYTFVGWNGRDATREYPADTPANHIAFRTGMFELLDQGFYFLASDPTVWANNWDNSSNEHIRHAVWAHLRVKESGEDFFVFATHLDHVGNIARMMQAQLNADMTWKIAGHKPVLLLGDHNANTTRVNVQRMLQSQFVDAFVAGGGAEKYGAEPATSGQWAVPVSGSRIDYILCRNFTVNDYFHSSELYDRTEAPSDHLAIFANLTLDDPDLAHRRRYVNPEAATAGNGTIGAPFNKLDAALSAASLGDTIFVTASRIELSRPYGLKKTVHIFGGYNPEFTEVTGLTSVTTNGQGCAFSITGQAPDGDSGGVLAAVEIRNFEFTNCGETADGKDGGAVRAHGAALTMQDCVFADNFTTRDGAAIDAWNRVTLRRVKFLRNRAGRNGGAVCFDSRNKRYWWNQLVEGCYFEENEAASGSAIYLPRFVYAWIAGNTFAANHSTDGPAVWLRATSTGSVLNAHLAVFNNTFAHNTNSGTEGATAILAEIDPDAPFSLTNNTIIAHDSSTPAVKLIAGVPVISNNLFGANRSGDIDLPTNSLSAVYNVYTSPTSLNYTPSPRDIVAPDYAASVAMLCSMLDCTPSTDSLSLTANLAPVADAPHAIPVVAVTNPAAPGGMTLCSVTAPRLKEVALKSDFDYDCMTLGTLTTDQTGRPRPASAITIGAVEYDPTTGPASIAAPTLSPTDAPAPLYDLQGRPMLTPNPAPGLYLRPGQKTLIR